MHSTAESAARLLSRQHNRMHQRITNEGPALQVWPEPCTVHVQEGVLRRAKEDDGYMQCNRQRSSMAQQQRRAPLIEAESLDSRNQDQLHVASALPGHGDTTVQPVCSVHRHAV